MSLIDTVYSFFYLGCENVLRCKKHNAGQNAHIVWEKWKTNTCNYLFKYSETLIDEVLSVEFFNGGPVFLFEFCSLALEFIFGYSLEFKLPVKSKEILVNFAIGGTWDMNICQRTTNHVKEKMVGNCISQFKFEWGK